MLRQPLARFYQAVAAIAELYSFNQPQRYSETAFDELLDELIWHHFGEVPVGFAGRLQQQLVQMAYRLRRLIDPMVSELTFQTRSPSGTLYFSGVLP